jgi:hypothetical protein
MDSMLSRHLKLKKIDESFQFMFLVFTAGV